MNWPWTGRRDRVLRSIDKRLALVEQGVKEGLEDEKLDEMLERMERIEGYMAPEEPTQQLAVAPQFAGVWERIPLRFRGIVDGAVEGYTGVSLKDAVSDPSGAKMKVVMEKIGPHMSSLMKFIPKDLMAQLQAQPTSTPSSTTGSGFDPYAQTQQGPE